MCTCESDQDRDEWLKTLAPQEVAEAIVAAVLGDISPDQSALLDRVAGNTPPTIPAHCYLELAVDGRSGCGKPIYRLSTWWGRGSFRGSLHIQLFYGDRWNAPAPHNWEVRKQR
jgi:hypothetical protein